MITTITSFILFGFFEPIEVLLIGIWHCEYLLDFQLQPFEKNFINEFIELKVHCFLKGMAGHVA